MDVKELSKGGECWLQLTIERKSKGLEVWAKADPRLEEFIANLSANPNKPDELSTLGQNGLGGGSKKWSSLDASKPIMVYKFDKAVGGDSYRLDLPHESLGVIGAWTNLTFLRFVGIGTDGIRFLVGGAYDRNYVKTVSVEIIKASRELIKDYIVPVHVSLRISSQEL